MGRLAGLTFLDVTHKLRRAGFEFYRCARGSHEIWWNPEARVRVMVPRHPGDIHEGTVRAIVRQTGLSVDEFLEL